MPTLLDNGRLLIFDNGTQRSYSRVIELDPVTLEVTWEYRADPPESFHSKWRGSSQRLPNGNTLICETDAGHVFEVTPQGERVWEFWNPELRGDRRKRIYRFMRVDAERAAWARARRARGPAAGPETKRELGVEPVLPESLIAANRAKEAARQEAAREAPQAPETAGSGL
jgi:hypothetical protein